MNIISFSHLAFTVKLFLCESIQSSISDAVEMGEPKILECATVIYTHAVVISN